MLAFLLKNTVGESWFLIDQEKLKTTLLLTWLLVYRLGKLSQELLADLTDWQSIINSLELRKHLDLTLDMPEKTFDILILSIKVIIAQTLIHEHLVSLSVWA